MKTVESRNTTATVMRETKPFFSKESDRHFFGSSKSEKPFFPGSGKHSSSIQPKLEVGHPDDAYEKEADSVADKVVSHIRQSQSQTESQNIATEAANTGCTGCEEKKIRKFEEQPEESEVKKLQRKPIFESNAEPPDDDSTLQKKSESPASQTSDHGVESSLSASKGSGHPLPEATRQKMESSIGADFSRVRIHDDSSSVQMSKDLNAQAFTHGNDIYFNSGKYDNESMGGQRLLAHELTHTVQQNRTTFPALQMAMIIQKEAKDDKKDVKDIDNSTIDALGTAREGYIKKNKAKIEIHFKDFVAKQYASPFLTKDEKGNEYISTPPFLKPTRERKTKQSYVWKKNATPLVEASLTALANTRKVKGPIYQLMPAPDLKKQYIKRIVITGSIEQIAKEVSVPFWGLDGRPVKHQIEHKIDWQIAGGNHDVDVISNLILLNDKENIRIGQFILSGMKKYYSKVVSFYKSKNIAGLTDDFDIAKGIYDIYTDNLVSDPDNVKGSLISISNMDPGKTLNPVSEKLVDITDEDIPEGHFSLKTSKKGAGNIVPYDLNNEFIEIKGDAKTHKLNSVTLKNVVKDDKGVLDKDKPDKSLEFTEESQDHYKVKTDGFAAVLKDIIRVKSLSPIEWEDLDFNPVTGWNASGKIKTNVELLDKANITIEIENSNFTIQSVIESDVLKGKLPKPFNIDYSSITIAAGTKDPFSITGNLGFSIEKVGKGNLKASAGYNKFGLEGKFDFDQFKSLKKSDIGFKYLKEGDKATWEISGELSVEKGAIKGVDNASVKIKYDGKFLSGDGEAKLLVPGIDKIKLGASFAENGDFSFTAEVELKKLPGIKSGKATVTITSKGEEGLKLGIGGEAELDFPVIPNLNPKLTISYNDGIYEIRTKVTYKKGRFEGTIEVGVTNKQVDEKGQPQGEPQEKGEVVVFGYGELKVDIYKDIRGGVSVRLTPERNVLIGGKIEAKELKPFGEGFKYDKEILPFPTLEIPLVGIPGMSVSAFIKGGVHFKFSWDPLILKEILIDFKETNINELEKVSLEITGSVGSSAHAEVYLSIEAGLKARVLIATLSGSLGGEAGLGLDAEAGGKVDAGWDMEKGLRFKEIRAYLNVTPKAIFRLTGNVSVDLDLWVTTINLYEHQWILAEKSLDLSGITLKVDFPVRFNENGDVELPAYESMNIQKPDFNGESGKAILDDAINGDAKKEEAARKEKIRTQIRTDLRSADNKDVSPTEYTGKMMKKYEKSPELQEFVRNTIEEECRKIEYEHFEENKNFILGQESPLNVKLNTLNVFTIFYGYVTPADIEAFRAELSRLEEEKKMKEAAAAAAAMDSGNKKVNDTPAPPDQPPADKNGTPVRKKGMIPEGVPLQRMKKDFDNEEEEYASDYARMNGGDPGEEFEQKLDQSGGKGHSIPDEERGQLEEVMGADFSGVRIHNDQDANELSKQINAQAFTRGNDVFFNAGKYDPSTEGGQRLLAHELAHVIQQEGERIKIRVQLHAVAATPRARKTHDDIFGMGPATGMTLRDFKTYSGQQADWFIEPTLTTPDRNDLWRLLLKTRPDSPVLSGAGDLTVTELRTVTDAQWTDLTVYCNGCDSSRHTVRIVPSGSLADRITLGATLIRLETAIPSIVLEHTLTEIQLRRIQSEALLLPMMVYFTLFQPHLQETTGSAAGLKGGVKSETELLLDFIKASGMGPFVSLLGTVRNLHRFAPDALTQLMSNYSDFSHKKPVYLVLYSGHDYNSAFLRSKALFEDLLKDKSKLVLMLEGQGSIQEIIDKVPKIAKDYGKPDNGKVNRIAQVMIAGHGSSRKVELAGTGAPTINAQGEVEYSVESLDLDKNAAKSVKLLEVLMDNMDPATARLVYAGCLVGSREVPVKDATGKALTAADISKEVNDPAKKSLAAYTRDMAAARGKGGMPVEGGRASVGLAESKSLLDAAGNLHVDYTFDPTAFGSANIYAASGREPEGVMRAAIELAAVDPVIAANQLRIRQGVAAKDTWYDPVTLIFVKAALDGVPPAGGIDIVKVNQLSHMAPHFFLSYWASRSIAHFGADVNANPALASTLYAEVLALPEMSAPGEIKARQGRFILELSWCMLDPARSANVIAYLDARADLTAEILEQHLNIAWLNSVNSGSTLFPAAAAVSDGRIRLAIAWLNKDNNNADVRIFLDGQVDDTGPRPRLKPPVLAQLSNPADEDNILLILGRLAPVVPSKGAGPALPAANADVFPNGKGPAMNEVRIEPNIYTAEVIPPAFVLNVRTLPSMAGKPFHWLKRGEKVNVMGFVHNWAAVDINGKLGFAYRNFLSAPPA